MFSVNTTDSVPKNCNLHTFLSVESWNGRLDNFIEHYVVHFLHFNLSRFFFASRKLCIMMLISIFFPSPCSFLPIAKFREEIWIKRWILLLIIFFFFREGIMMNLFLVSRFLCILCIFNMDELVVFSSSSSIPVRSNTQKKSILFSIRHASH